MKTKKQLKCLSKTSLIEYVQGVETDLDLCIATNVELKHLLHESNQRVRKILLRKVNV